MNVLREKTSDGDLEHASKEKLMEGKIIGCLKEHFVILQQSPEGDHDPSKFLSKKCATHIEKIMSEEAQDFELDPELMKSCGGTSLSPLSEDGMCSRKKHTDPIECLKQHFMDENLKGEHLTECRKYVALLIKESQVQSLYSTLVAPLFHPHTYLHSHPYITLTIISPSPLYHPYRYFNLAFISPRV